jgi:DNA repair exonuclease SbcCD ATPase subunit
MFKITDITVKNFMSVGNSTQGIQFDRTDLTLVLGKNLDLGGDDSGARNGTGKTTIINALSYALYGEALTKIRKENLINKTNGKSMLVTIDFAKDGNSYRIERGRKPNVLKFYINNTEQDDNNAQGDSRETQKEIQSLLGMSHDMFKHVVALNTYTEPFLSMRANDQRVMIEQLLGITMLSEKADTLKEQIKETKDAVKQEDFRIKAVKEANEHVTTQISNLERRSVMWETKKQEDVVSFQTAIAELDRVDIEAELEAHKCLVTYKEQERNIKDLDTAINANKNTVESSAKKVEKYNKELEQLQDHKCFTCGQEFHDAKQEQLIVSKQEDIDELAEDIANAEQDLRTLEDARKELGELEPCPPTFYKNIDDAYNHKQQVDTLQTQLEQKQEETNPYTEQIEEMKTTAVQEIDYDKINEYNRRLEHQDFLLKLLTNKDSFIRKTIIDQNLAYLNARLSHYLEKIGLPHQVIFLSDLTVDIQELGRELDFDNLSRGERNRLILSLSWAFRDVYESLYQPINVLFIDEVIDHGMDALGVESSLAILKKMAREGNKAVWLVSHKDELAGRVNNILNVVKENGFTSYNNDVDMA